MAACARAILLVCGWTLLAAVSVPRALAVTDGYVRASSNSTELLPLGPKSKKYMVDPAAGLASLGPTVTGLHFSRYADPEWDKEFFGVG